MRESSHERGGVGVREPRGFATALAQHRPALFLKFAHSSVDTADRFQRFEFIESRTRTPLEQFTVFSFQPEYFPARLKTGN
jgi:hypothetical protein